MCRRTTGDPLARMFLDQFSLNLLQIPRENARVGDLYAVLGDRALPPGRTGDILDPSPELPELKTEPLGDLAGVVSDAVSVQAGVGLLEGFLTAMGAAGLVADARVRYGSGAVRGLRFRLTDAMRESVSTGELGNALIGCRHDQGIRWWETTIATTSPRVWSGRRRST